jgi:hypothetical protein
MNDVLAKRLDLSYLMDLLYRIHFSYSLAQDLDKEVWNKLEVLVEPLSPATHIEWGNKPICHFTSVPVKDWPSELQVVNINNVTAKRFHQESWGKRTETIAYPPEDWAGVTCTDCKAELPVLLRKVEEVFGEMREGIVKGIDEAFNKK